MPGLNTGLHLNMLRDALNAKQPERDGLYGLHWGDPEQSPVLAGIRDRFLLPYVTTDTTVCEIGPGGGRWTRYLIDCKFLYAVDVHQELLDELQKNFDRQNIIYIRNGGSDFPGIPDGSVDFLFTFGVFVHLDLDIIDSYLGEMRRVLTEGGTAVIQYSDKRKAAAQRNKSFSENDPRKMRALVRKHNYVIHEEDTESLWHSAVIRIGLCANT